MKIAAFLIVFLLILSHNIMAQGGPPPDPFGVPLDPLSWLLLVIGGIISARKHFTDKK